MFHFLNHIDPWIYQYFSLLMSHMNALFQRGGGSVHSWSELWVFKKNLALTTGYGRILTQRLNLLSPQMWNGKTLKILCDFSIFMCLIDSVSLNIWSCSVPHWYEYSGKWPACSFLKLQVFIKLLRLSFGYGPVYFFSDCAF
jgi:hypothetical protein